MSNMVLLEESEPKIPNNPDYCSKMLARHHKRARAKTRIRVESMVGVFDMFSLKIVSPLWRNDLSFATSNTVLPLAMWRMVSATPASLSMTVVSMTP